MRLPLFLFFACLGLVAADRPNIIVILADDQGFGDLGANNPQSKIATPHLDALAKGGVRFTDGHTSSGVCTPTRYALVTGRYCWRTSLNHGGVANTLDPLLIENAWGQKVVIATPTTTPSFHMVVSGAWTYSIVPTAAPTSTPHTEPFTSPTIVSRRTRRSAPVDQSAHITRTGWKRRRTPLARSVFRPKASIPLTN